MDFQAMLQAARAEAAKERAQKQNGPQPPAAANLPHQPQQPNKPQLAEDNKAGNSDLDRARERQAREMQSYLARECNISPERALPAAPLSARRLAGAVSSVFYWPDWISQQEETRMLALCWAAPAHKWTQLKRRRLQNWGGQVRLRPGSELSSQGVGRLEEKEALPPYMQALGARLVSDGVFPKEKRPNHVLLNHYEPGQGIMAHKDGPLYHPVVAIVSLGGPALMRFYRQLANTRQEHGELFSVLLQPRSLLVFSEEAYRDLFHCIPELDVPCERVSKTCANRGWLSLG
eukprot:g42963.t1